MEIMLLSWETV